MTRHIVVGAGVAGQHHLRVLNIAGLDVLQVLDKSQVDFKSSFETTLQNSAHNTIWHICTPTETHIDYLKIILNANPNALIIVEKPIGSHALEKDYFAFFSGASVMVQSQYNYSKVVGIFSKMLAGIRAVDKIKIKIDFSKNRLEDNRFVDKQRKALGYEAFHQLTLLLRLFDSVRGSSFSDEFCESAVITESYSDYKFYQVRLSYKNFDILLRSNLTAHERMAKLGVAYSKDISISLHIEADDWYTGTPRQTHVIKTNLDEFVFEEDLMHTGVITCVDILSKSNSKMILSNQIRAFQVERLLDRIGAVVL
jgi:hypothetical protein